jgi:nucleoside-diphosphate-sugar epimerase
MKVLVTGACGRIGLAVTEKLVSANHEVVAYDRAGSDLPHGASLIEGDVRDFAHVTEVARGCEAGIHLAAVADGATVTEILSINALGAYGFLAAARETGFRRTILAGSASVHLPPSDRDNSFPPPSDGEDHVYDLSKALQEVIANDFRSHGLAVLCLRFGHIVRGEEETTLRGSLALKDEHYCRGGWVALEDIAEAFLAGLALQPSEDALEILNIVGARGARDRFRVAAAENRLGITLRYDFASYEPAEPARGSNDQPVIGPYFERPFTTINADDLVEATLGGAVANRALNLASRPSLPLPLDHREVN